MPVDPTIFDHQAVAHGIERWPNNGERIRVRYRDGTHLEEVTVVRVWLGIEVMIDVEGATAVCPALGDIFEILTGVPLDRLP
jgi:hypothetical protein